MSVSVCVCVCVCATIAAAAAAVVAVVKEMVLSGINLIPCLYFTTVSHTDVVVMLLVVVVVMVAAVVVDVGSSLNHVDQLQLKKKKKVWLFSDVSVCFSCTLVNPH